ncbi:hypothetical protein [Sandaracinus amylolyticus]|uniref:hypothetical protein n=1 Tax=Sandaracinus amylolyticus TaxID=927083 RepID=UPI0012ED6C32|nr:hypothetical protein [Sandaracinus amylolyticus]
MTSLAGVRAEDAIVALVPFAAARSWPARDAGDRARFDAISAIAEGALAALVDRVPSHAWIAIDAKVRATRWSPHEHRARERWLAITPDAVRASASLLALASLSLHASGYVREAALVELMAYREEALPWIVLRTVDWVAPVRARAAGIVRDHLRRERASALLGVLPLALRLLAFSRVDAGPVVDGVVATVRASPEDALRAGVEHRSASVRRALVELLDHPSRELVDLALHDRDSGVRSRVARHVGTEPADAARRALLRRDPLARLRVRGIELELDASPSTVVPVLHAALRDPERRVRDLALSALASRGERVDLAAIHRREIVAGRISRGAIRVLGDHGVASDWELLVPALDASPKLARAALGAMRRLDRSATREIRLMLVDDPRPKLSRDAMLSLAGQIWAEDERWIRAYLRSPHVHVRAHAARLAIQLGGWAPPLVLLEIASDPEIRMTVEHALASWLGRRWRAGAAPSPEDARALRDLLARTSISRPLRDSLRSLVDFLSPGAR